MLRNRSRAVTTKQTLMADQTSVLSPTKNPSSSSSSSCSSPISSFLNSPRFFNGFLTKNLFSDTETTTNVMSPTSILVNPFGYDKILSKFQNPIAKQDTKVIGLALIDTITIDEKKSDDKIGKFSNKPINRASLYGSKLKVQIPVINPTSSLISPNNDDDVSPKSPADFGIKTTKNSQNSSTTTTTTPTPVRDNHLTRQLSLKEMELSEDYTRVITHGPNPKTTHIFDDCIVERCLGDDSKNYDDECSSKKMDCGFVEINVSTESFLSFCHTCRDMLGQGKDIYIYRGEKAFCSHECRCQEMFFEEMKNPELDE